ncbi:MAG: hypothetical protein AABZ77_06500, partial [Chloroflexota bacterium]
KTMIQGGRVTRNSIREYVEAIKGRYRKEARKRKVRFWMSLRRRPGYTGKPPFVPLTAAALLHWVNGVEDRGSMGMRW